jgi:hypothetical protein
MKKQFWRILQRPSIAIGSNVSGDKASTLGTPATSAVIAHQDQKLADYIDYYQILYPPVLEQMRDYSSDNRTKFDFVVACGQSWRMRMEWEGLLQDQVLLRRN